MTRASSGPSGGKRPSVPLTAARATQRPTSSGSTHFNGSPAPLSMAERSWPAFACSPIRQPAERSSDPCGLDWMALAEPSEISGLDAAVVEERWPFGLRQGLDLGGGENTGFSAGMAPRATRQACALKQGCSADSWSHLASGFSAVHCLRPCSGLQSPNPLNSLSMLVKPLAQRHRQPEWMDQPGIDPAAHSQALQGLRRINAFSGAVGSLFAPIRSLARVRSGCPLRVLDLACGGGDNTTALAERARREGLNVQVDGCDLSPQAVAIAARSAEERGLNARFFQADALHDPLPGDYDVILCTLFLHHLEDEEAVDLLRRMGRASRCLVLVNDLIRSPLGYGLAWAGCRLLSRSPIVHFDGPVSVQGAFQLSEVRALAARAGLDAVQVRRSWPERYLLEWRRPDAPLQVR